MKAIRMLIPSAVLSIFLYIILHEFGHTIVLWLAGADITDFSILSAHVNYIGGEWTNASDRWMHLNGTLFPIIVAVAYILLYRKNITNRFYRVFSGFFVVMPIGSLLAWVFIPLLYMSGQAPENDDVYKFLYNFTFDYPAYFVSIVAVIVIICCIYIAVKKDIVKNFRETVKQIRKEKSE